MSAVQSAIATNEVNAAMELYVQLQQQDLQVLFQEYYLLLKRGWD